MKWRLLKLDWKYAIGELIIVTLGVLLALYVGEWNSNRLALADELVILDRLISDLQSDARTLDLGEDILIEKVSALQRLFNIEEQNYLTKDDHQNLISDVRLSSTWGWNQAIARTTTYDELVGSGRFNLIRDSSVRNAVSDYYRFFEGASARQSERETPYPSFSLTLAPIEENPATLSDTQLERTLDRIKDVEAQDLIFAELNFAYFATRMLQGQKSRNEELIQILEAYNSTLD